MVQESNTKLHIECFAINSSEQADVDCKSLFSSYKTTKSYLLIETLDKS